MRIVLLIAFFAFCTFLNAQITLTTAGYTNNFNNYRGSAVTIPPGVTVTTANFRGVNNGSNNTGGAYGYTIDNVDHSLGGLRSGSNPTIIYEISFIYNEPGVSSPLREMNISYNFEQYRFANTSGIDVSGGGALAGQNLSVLSQAGTTTGTNGIVAVTPKTVTLLNLDIQPMETFSIIFTWNDASGADNGLAVDNFSISSVVLPVDLVSFDAQNNGSVNKLNWETASEINNSHFEILHATDERSYTKIGMIKGSGNTEEMQSYEFIHENVKNGNHFYQLRQVDFDGNSETFGPVVARVNNNSLRFFPTIADQSINFEGDIQNESYSIYSIEGRLMQSGQIDSNVDISAIPSGIYYIKFANKTEQLYKI